MPQSVDTSGASPNEERSMQAVMPGFIAPMLAQPVRELPEGPEWQYEVKWDGYRIEAMKHGTGV
jgi:ATP-dependent DNA ligase